MQREEAQWCSIAASAGTGHRFRQISGELCQAENENAAWSMSWKGFIDAESLSTRWQRTIARRVSTCGGGAGATLYHARDDAHNPFDEAKSAALIRRAIDTAQKRKGDGEICKPIISARRHE